MPQTPPGLGRLRRANFSAPACTFKISRYAANYQYLIAYEVRAQGMEEETWSGRGWRGGGGCILKIVIVKGGTSSYVIIRGGKVLIHHTFLIKWLLMLFKVIYN